MVAVVAVVLLAAVVAKVLVVVVAAAGVVVVTFYGCIEEGSTEKPQLVCTNYIQVLFCKICFVLFCFNMKIYMTFKFMQ
jgi:hypothetical protein